MRRGSSRRRWTTLAAVAAVAVALVPMAASAHTYLESSRPAAEATITAQIKTVTLVFNRDVHQTIAEMQLTAPDGQRLGTDGPVIDGRRVQLPVGPLPEHGEYVVRYRVVADDGHPIRGKFTFTYEGPLPPQPASETEATEEPTDEPGQAATDAPAVAGGSGETAPMAAALEGPSPETAGAVVRNSWPLLLLAAIVLAAALAGCLYAVRVVVRWDPDTG